MDKTVEGFIQNHRISVLTVLTVNNTPHSATIHYAAEFDPLQFVFLTDKKSKKVEPLLSSAEVPASLVIGFSEEEWVTVQMHGTLKIAMNEEESSKAWEVYSSKYIGSDKYKTNKESTILVFTPIWWRYTKLKPKPMQIITSEDK